MNSLNVKIPEEWTHLDQGIMIGVIIGIMNEPNTSGKKPDDDIFKGWKILEAMKEYGWKHTGNQYPQN